MSEPTPKGAWPTCANHPDQYLSWRRDGWGWRCPVERDADEATLQPWEPGANGNGAVPIKPWEMVSGKRKYRTRPPGVDLDAAA